MCLQLIHKRGAVRSGALGVKGNAWNGYSYEALIGVFLPNSVSELILTAPTCCGRRQEAGKADGEIWTCFPRLASCTKRLTARAHETNYISFYTDKYWQILSPGQDSGLSLLFFLCRQIGNSKCWIFFNIVYGRAGWDGSHQTFFSFTAKYGGREVQNTLTSSKTT